MVSLHPTTWYLLLEALALLSTGIGLLIFLALRRYKRRKATLLTLVERLKNGGAQRNAAIQSSLKQSGAFDDKQLADISQQVLTAETHFYQFLVKALIHPDQRDLAQLDQHVEALTDAINKAVPHSAATGGSTGAAPAAAASSNELAEIKQALAALQKNQGQLAGEVKSSAESLRKAIAALGSVSAATRVSTATATPAAAIVADSGLDLEALPDIEEAATSAPPAQSVESVSAPAQPPVPAATSGDQIAEMPDDLLDEVRADPATTPADAPAIQIEEETPAAAATSDSDIAEMPDDLLGETTTPDTAASAADALIDELISETAEKSKATLTTPAAAPAAEASPEDFSQVEPLIPEVETAPADKGAREPQGKVQSTTSVDDLLLELDELLK